MNVSGVGVLVNECVRLWKVVARCVHFRIIWLMTSRGPFLFLLFSRFAELFASSNSEQERNATGR